MKWCYYPKSGRIWHRSRPELYEHFFEGNQFLATRLSTEKIPKGSPFYLTKHMIDCQALARNVSVIPFFLKNSGKNQKKKTLQLFQDTKNEPIKINVSNEVIDYFLALSISLTNTNLEQIWLHVLSIGYSPDYLLENQDGIKNDYPRIPLPNNPTLLDNSIKSGQKLARLFDIEEEIEGVTVNTNSLQKAIAVISKFDNKSIQRKELVLDANWGKKTVQGVMPGKGKIKERTFSKDEYEAFAKAGYKKEQIHHFLGNSTFDVYINDQVFWKNIPNKAWEYRIGGYQVIKKWLSYREESIIHRPLKKEEVREVVNMARRITAIILMEDELNKNYKKVKCNIFNY
ncbi:type ISP restriction/modification enzyme [candidate division KSB1 bacterium]